MSKAVIRVGTALAVATIACIGVVHAQFRHPGGAPAAAPHISAPAAAPHFNAAPHINAAPRISVAPHVSAPRFSAPSVARGGGVHAYAPRAHASMPRSFAHQTFRGPTATRGLANRHAFQGRVAGRSGTRSVSRNAIAGRGVSRQALRDMRNAGALSRSATRGRAGARALAKTNVRPGMTSRPMAQANTHDNLRGGRVAALGGPLGARNRNFADRRKFFDERRRFHHGGFVGWFGPVFWPYAYDDVFDYAFWPAAYDDYGFWANAYDDLLDSVFWSPDTRDIYASVGAPEGRRGRSSGSSSSQGQRIEQAYRTAAQTCRAGEPGLTQWPVEQIAQVVQPTPDQQKLLDDLKAASDQAIKQLQAVCPANQPATPLGRLDAIASRLGAMLQAVDTVRPALASFFDSLSDEQKARFNAMGQVENASADRGDAAAAKGQARLCGGQAPLTAQAIRRIEQEVRPNGSQTETLAALRDSTARAADLLREACPTQTPITPVARLDAMGKHLQAMLDAVKTVRPALARFYDSLSDEQKAHFNIMRPRQG